MTMQADMAFNARMEPRLIKQPKPYKSRTARLPFGLGRLGFTKDPGEGDIFNTNLFETRLRAIVRDSQDRVIEEYDLGSGTVTNVGVLALAWDSQLTKIGAAKEDFSLFANLAYHQWGTSGTAMAATDVKLGIAAETENTKSADKAVKGTNTVTPSGVGSPKFVSTATLEAAGTLKIEEWGIFTRELLKAEFAKGKFESVTASSGKIPAEAPEFTESTTEAQGERLKIALATESEETWLLVKENSKTELKGIGEWYKQSNGAQKTPTGTSKFTVRPVMFDRRTFGVITVEKGNKIEFPWELEIKSGG